MEYIRLKNSDLLVSRLCMGGCPMGRYDWGSDVVENELIDAVHCAIDCGVNFFDTADTYGLGQSEETLGKAVRGRRDKVVLASKFGVHAKRGTPTFYDNSPAWIRRSIDGTLRRLGTDYLDLYQMHYRDGKTPLSEMVDTLEELKREGKIRYYGLSNLHIGDRDELAAYKGRFVSLQDEYSLAQRKNEADILQLSRELQVTPMTWGSLGQGILTGKYHRGNVNFKAGDRRSREIYVNFHGEKLLKNLKIVEVLKELAQQYQKPVSAVAIRFILDYLPESVVLCGVKRPAQMLDNVQGCDWTLRREDVERLAAVSV